MTIFGAEDKVSAGSDGGDKVERFTVAGVILITDYGADEEKIGLDSNKAGERGIFVSKIFEKTRVGEVVLVIEFEIVAATAFSNLDAVLITIFDGAGDEKEFLKVDAADFSVIVFILSGLDTVK